MIIVNILMGLALPVLNIYSKWPNLCAARLQDRRNTKLINTDKRALWIWVVLGADSMLWTHLEDIAGMVVCFVLHAVFVDSS